MPRTFSLGRLLYVTTLIGVACGIAVNLPEGFSFFLMLSGPGLLPAIAIALFARYRGVLLVFAFIGLLYGIAMLPMLGRNPLSNGFYPGDGFRLFMLVFLPGLFATIAAGSYLHVERCLLNLKNKQPQLHTHSLQSLE